ncbi:uncharacterized protein LOC110874686 [Helianthus annuus]|uniref:uncharacterized protein LOC110874685 n=1 Tax=Helianthus annuus TaxID=4232 RepID=UPI000B903D09|nr:uncharacterized protein LOC110874685 [Helianthus annuus]XP_021978879.1 uncharacterized protein LOC110874686 [Helianthus annuus]
MRGGDAASWFSSTSASGLARANRLLRLVFLVRFILVRVRFSFESGSSDRSNSTLGQVRVSVRVSGQRQSNWSAELAVIGTRVLRLRIIYLVRSLGFPNLLLVRYFTRKRKRSQC